MFIAPGQGQTAPRGQNFDVNKKVLSFYPFVASFKEITLKSALSWAIQDHWLSGLFHDLIHAYSPGAGGIHPPGDKVLMSTGISCHFGNMLLVSNHRRQLFIKNPLFYRFPIKEHKGPNLTFRKIGQGQPRVGHPLNKLGSTWAPDAAYQASRSSAFCFRRRRFYLRFLPNIWAWQPSWSCDLDRLNKLSFLHPMEAPYEIWLIGQAVSEEMFKEYGRQTTDGQRPNYPIRSPVSLRLRWANNKSNSFGVFSFFYCIYRKAYSTATYVWILQRAWPEIEKIKSVIDNIQPQLCSDRKLLTLHWHENK